MPKGIFFNLLVVSFLSVQYLDAQKVTVSREIGIRNNYSYDILPNIEDRIIFYHDRGIEHNFEIYDNNLRYINTIQPEFEKKNILPAGVIPMDSAFHFYYSYKEDNSIFFRVNAYDKTVAIRDSATLLVKNRRDFNSNPRFAFSKDKSKVLIFLPGDHYINLIMVDNHALKVIYEFNLAVKDVNLKTEFEKLIVTNDGEVYITGRKTSMWERKKSNGFMLIRIKSPNDILLHKFSPESNEITELQLDFDEKNKRLVLAGFITQSDENKANGYFAFSIKPDDIPEDAEILVNKFTTEFIAEVTGKKPGKVKELSDFRIEKVVVRNDGGVIMIIELVREFTRRSQMNTPTQFGDYFPARGFIDYYHEDIILLATFQDGSEHWKKILFKKQFSQDDNGIYSSFFLFSTPSRLRLIYNDEIKNSNTVSEYVINPNGIAERKSVLSTEYQNLKLRFKDAIQIGPSSLIVPSEKSWKINLVKIDYE